MSEDFTNPQISIANSSGQSSRRLLFDRRYGWVFDEWKEPSEEALSGGRGMFCILPLAKAFLKTTSQSINLAADVAVKVLERPDRFSPQVVQASLDQHLNEFKSSIQRPQFYRFDLKQKFPLDASPFFKPTN